MGGSIHRAATRVSAASDQRATTARPNHRTNERKKLLRSGVLGGMGGVVVTFQDNRLDRVAAWVLILRARRRSTAFCSGGMGQSLLLLKAMESRYKTRAGFAPRRRQPGSGLQAVIDYRRKAGKWRSARVGWAPALRGQQKNAGASAPRRCACNAMNSLFNIQPQSSAANSAPVPWNWLHPRYPACKGISLRGETGCGKRPASARKSPRHPPGAKAQLIPSPFRHD